MNFDEGMFIEFIASPLVKMMARMENEPPEAMLQQSREFEREKTELEETLSRMGEEIVKLQQTSMRIDLAGKTLRYLAGIPDHSRVTADQANAHKGRVDAVRTASDETWNLFLREFKLWCALRKPQRSLALTVLALRGKAPRP